MTNDDDDDVTDYIGLDKLRRFVKLPDNDDENEDSQRSILLDACEEVDNTLLPFAEKIPVPRGDELFAKGKKLVVAYFRVLWAIEQRQFDLVKENQEIYKEKKKILIETLKANRTTRTRRVTVGTKPQTRRLFSQVKRY